MIHLDTNAVIWLQGDQLQRFSAYARGRLEAEPLFVSPAVDLELTYLHEVGKLRQPAAEVLGALGAAVGLRLSDASFASVVRTARDLGWTRDPFDRLVAAQALADRADLLTADHTIREHLPSAFWDQAPRSSR